MPAWEVRHRDGAGVIALSGDWASQANVSAPEVTRLWRNRSIREVAFEASRLGRWDTMRAAFLWGLKRAPAASGVISDDSGVPRPARQPLGPLPAEPPVRSRSLSRQFWPVSASLA